MDIKQRAYVFWGILALFLSISCAGSPPPVEEPAEPPGSQTPAPPSLGDPNREPPSQAALDALDAAIREANYIRQQVIDFEGPDYFPEDWNVAESQYGSAGDRTGRDTRGDVQEALDRYRGLAGVYSELLRRALPLYAGHREQEIQEARDAAINAGIQDLFPEHLLLADEKALEALDQYEGGDHYPAAASAALALDMYRVLKTGAGVYRIREEIVTRNFIQYVSDEFEQADAAGTVAIASYEAGQMEGLQKNVEDIQSLYGSILKAGWISFVTEQEAGARAERQAALDAKANVAVRSEFDAAAALYNQADASFKAENYDDAALFYGQAEFQFANAAKNALEKRQAAETAIRAAEEKMIESDENARRAELVIEGGAL
jgi:hypothetical protein